MRGFYNDHPDIPNGKIHEGFNHCYLILKALIFKHLKTTILRHPDKTIPILITGHSLGGAIATLFAVDCRHTYNDRQV